MTVFVESAVDDAITYTPLLEDVFVVTSSFIGKSKKRFSRTEGLLSTWLTTHARV